MGNIELFYSSDRGIYIPQVFANDIDRSKVTGISEEQYDILESGPYEEFYWEVWEEVLNSAKLTLSDGKSYSLHHDGDLWLIDFYNAGKDELNNLFGE